MNIVELIKKFEQLATLIARYNWRLSFGSLRSGG